MEDDSPFRRLSLQEYPGRNYVYQPVAAPGSPVLPVRRRVTVSQPVPRNVQYEYVPTLPSDGVIRKYSLEEYQVVEPAEQYIQGQSVQSFIPVMSVQSTPGNLAYRPVQQVQPYYSVQASPTVVNTAGKPVTSSTSSAMQNSPPSQPQQQGQAHLIQQQHQSQAHLMKQQPQQLQQQPCQHPVQQVQYVRPVQKMPQLQPAMEFVEVPAQISPTMTSFVPVNYPHHAEYHHELSGIREDKDQSLQYEDDVFVKSRRRFPNLSEGKSVEEVALVDIPEYTPLKRVARKKKSSEDTPNNISSPSRPRRRHTVHDAPNIEPKSRRNSMCPMTAYNLRGSSTVAIDNKIEQAMDLVKSHLMFAVREEVEVLKEQIAELIERNNQLEYENGILRAAASAETLAKLAQPRQQPPSSSS